MDYYEKSVYVILTLCILFCSFPFSVSAVDDIIADDNAVLHPSTASKISYVPNEIIVTTDYYVDPDNYSDGKPRDFHGVKIIGIEKLFFAETEEDISDRIERVGNVFQYNVTISPSVDADSAVSILNSKKGILNAQRNVCCIESINNKAVEVGGSSDLLDQTRGYWDVETYLELDDIRGKFPGSDSVKVAILDDGGGAHSDLQDNLNTSLAYDAVNNSSSVSATDHGNMVAGIIGADCDNYGVDGVCKNVTMFHVRVAYEHCEEESERVTYLSCVIRGVVEAVRKVQILLT